MSARRGRVLELAVLGHLARVPMHGYGLRKHLNRELGAFRAFSYGSLYPCLRGLLEQGLVRAHPAARGTPGGRRPRIVYRLTAGGRERLTALLAESGPAATDDDCFGVHFSLFTRTRSEVRLRILRGRRDRIQQRLGPLRERHLDTDPYIHELNSHLTEALELEVRWLDELIRREHHVAWQQT